ncbi:hypothetical protein [Risungbinella massiliensis]|uniref:hypothetical protein n=1 Tax=Risungbinella massiliensis TaxID=1329796 RepID=UPI0005CC5CD8|nr:hypothetical protein [Risungbinella massiliensis]
MKGNLGFAGVAFGLILLVFAVFVFFVTLGIAVVVGPEVIVPGSIVALLLLFIAFAYIKFGVK